MGQLHKVEIMAMEALKSKWSHLFIFGYPQQPYPTNFADDMHQWMAGYFMAIEKSNELNEKLSLLEWIDKENFVKHHTKGWYSSKRMKIPPSNYYSPEDLIKLFENEQVK